MKAIVRVLGNTYVQLCMRLFLGITFIFSAVTKLPIQAAFIDVVKDYHLLPESLAFAYGAVLPWLELLIGVYFIFGILLRPSAIVTLLLGISFLVANVSAIMKGVEYCGSCFGEVIPMSAQAALAYDFLIMAAAVAVLVRGSAKQMFSIDVRFGRGQPAMESGCVENQDAADCIAPEDNADKDSSF